MSGIGRGRGWLNINKNTCPRPGTQDHSESVNYDFNTISSTTSSANSKYNKLISKVALLNENDDGILLNQKLKHLNEIFKEECSTSEDVKDAFNVLYENSLSDENFASKAVILAAANSTSITMIHGIKIRNLFITRFQQDFEDKTKLQDTNPKAFRNAVKMFGDFFHKGRLADGQPFTFLSEAMCNYLDMLLDSHNEADLQLFATQLYMNGLAIKKEKPQNMNDLLIKIRQTLIYNSNLSTNSKLWLMMALDIANNQFSSLLTDIYMFYLSKLGDTAMARIKKLSSELNNQLNYQNSTMENVQSSNVNVIQQQVSSSSSGWESPSSTNFEQDNTNLASTSTDSEQYASSSSSSTNVRNNFGKIGTWEGKNEKTPRPILGAGARNKHDQHNKRNDGNNWRDHKNDGEWKENSNWDNKKKGGSGGWNKQKKTNSKGWEHDDRFVNEYK